jgi:riboflavin biosynthesis pyrimidine reductase
MMLSTLDGAVAGADGVSASISSTADRLILAEVRRLADAVLVGAGTIRAERYKPMAARTEYQQARAAAGLQPAPVVAIVSRTLDLPWQEPLFHESAQQPIVLTGVHDSSSGALKRAQAHADVQQIPDLEARTILGALHARGLSRIVCEGGPTLMTQMAAANLIDEYDIALAPILAGDGHGIIDGPLTGITRLHLAQVITDEGFVFTKYVR